MDLIRREDILRARAVVGVKLHRTPMLTSHTVATMLGVKLYLKAEMFQKTGSFKPRGALYKLSSLSPTEKAAGVVGFSAGNHAAGLAYAASLAGIKATIVMPEAAVKSKVDATRAYGGSVILHGTGKDLLPKTQELQRAHGYTLVHPFDDPFTIAGQGTVGLEIIEHVMTPDVVVVPIGGGGLIAGVATIVKETYPRAKVIGVEPVGAAGMTRALEHGAVVALEKIETIADGLAAPFAGVHTLAHVQRYVDEVVLVTDEEIMAAMRLLMERCKLVVEPAGAAGFAALLHHKFAVADGATVVCVLSGGNVDLGRLKGMI